MNEKLKSYYQWSLEETEDNFDGEEYHILSPNTEDPDEDANFTDEELEIVQEYIERHGRLPVVGRLGSNNTKAEYPWHFEGSNAKGGYSKDVSGSYRESLEIDQKFGEFQACHRYILGSDVDSMINCLVDLLFKDCAVGEVDEQCLFGWIYVADLQHGRSYYGSQETIFPPNYYDDDDEFDRRKNLDQIIEIKKNTEIAYPLYLKFVNI